MFSTEHYKEIASVICNRLTVNQAPFVYSDDSEYSVYMSKRNEDIDIALEMARMFQKDSELFKPILFLDACSPDPEEYPLSEMWEGGEKND